MAKLLQISKNNFIEISKDLDKKDFVEILSKIGETYVLTGETISFIEVTGDSLKPVVEVNLTVILDRIRALEEENRVLKTQNQNLKNLVKD